MTVSDPDLPPSTGLVGGKYQLVKLIGRGGMGSVWEARHCNLGTTVAIKFIEAEYTNSTEARSRFDKEAKAAATIQSKHAIQIHDNGITEDGKPYIVMELLRGEPLDKRIDRLGMLTLQDTARILQQVCRGLSKAHERGIIHRDLKPENVFIVHNNDDDEEVAKVLDFGIAKIQSTNPGVTSSTKTGAVLGTPFFMSPEQARGLRNVDHRTDVWSLGVIAFKCVTGKLPFDGESVGDLLVKICTAPIPLPSQYVPGLPAAFDSWFLRALERDPERRFANVSELADHLAFAAGISARGVTSPAFSGPQAAADSATVQAHGSHPRGSNPMPYGASTPNPAGMTAAPFTSSQPVAGLGSGRTKWIVAAALTGLLVAGAATAAVVKYGRPHAAAGAGVTQSAAADTSALPAATAATPPEPFPAPSVLPVAEDPSPVAAGASLSASTPAAPPHAGHNSTSNSGKATTNMGTRKFGITAKPPGAVPPLPPPAGVGPALPPPVAATPPPVAAPAAKKPNRNDPGY